MSKKMMLLALAAVSAAMFALPAVASAESWHQVPAAGATGPNFTVSGGVQELENTAGGKVSCDTVTGEGHYDANSTTTGTVELTFHGCANGAPTSFLTCTTSGSPSDTITTKTLKFHNIMIDPGTPGVLLTPDANGTFAEFSCFGVPVRVTGNGVIGHLSNKCGEKSNKGTLTFATSATGTQKYQQITTTGTKFDLHSTLNSGATAAQSGSGTITSAQEATVVCTNP